MSGAAISPAPLRFAGYAAVFDRLDNGGDVIAPGAFAASLSRLSGREVPLLWQHGPEQRIGAIERVAEDARGLRVVGRIEGRGPAARKAAAFLKEGHLDGLSFGYRVVAAQGERPRRLEALELVEVSLVTHPMQPLARVHAVE